MAITLMVAEGKFEEKEIMVKVVVNLINLETEAIVQQTVGSIGQHIVAQLPIFIESEFLARNVLIFMP